MTHDRAAAYADMDERRLRAAAGGILEANWRGDHTVPAGGLYPHQWSWDSAFIAFGLRHLSPARARQELMSLFAAQWQDGRIPQIVFTPGPEDAYFPGRGFWRSWEIPGSPAIATAGLIQPPNHAWAVWAVHEADPEGSRAERFLDRAYGPLCRWHDYLRTRRDRGGRGLLAALHPWETGMDNSPAWDLPLSRVPEQAGLVLDRPDLRHADASERPSNKEYARYVYLAERYRASGCADDDTGFPFLVEDPGMNALWAVSEHALESIASEVGADRGVHGRRAHQVTAALGELFAPQLRAYVARDVVTGALLPEVTVSGLLTLLVPGLDTHDAVMETLRGPRFDLSGTLMVASYDLTGPEADLAAYWRGPAWFNTTWMLVQALRRLSLDGEANRLVTSMCRLAVDHDFPEYVDPRTGAPHGTRRFSWTAALVLDAALTAGGAHADR